MFYYWHDPCEYLLGSLCRLHLLCNVCHGLVEIIELSAAKRYELRRLTAWVCPGCIKRGFTHKNTNTYKCSVADCLCERGHKLFIGQDIRNVDRGRLRNLSCKACKDTKRQRKK